MYMINRITSPNHSRKKKIDLLGWLAYWCWWVIDAQLLKSTQSSQILSSLILALARPSIRDFLGWWTSRIRPLLHTRTSDGDGSVCRSTTASTRTVNEADPREPEPTASLQLPRVVDRRTTQQQLSLDRTPINSVSMQHQELQLGSASTTSLSASPLGQENLK